MQNTTRTAHETSFYCGIRSVLADIADVAQYMIFVGCLDSKPECLP
jgi:hypothetical protein